MTEPGRTAWKKRRSRESGHPPCYRNIASRSSSVEAYEGVAGAMGE